MASPASSVAAGSATSSSSSSPAEATAAMTTPSSAASMPTTFVFGTSPSTADGLPAASYSQFAPLFSSDAPAFSPPAPRLPIFSDHITNHIKFLLNPADHNYHKWKTFFLMVLLRYGVSYLIEQPPPANATAAYLELDAHMVLWIYATLSDTMCDHVVGATTTYALWHKIKEFFLANRVARYMILNRQYRNLKQGDLSVTEYARRMKLLTDGLADIDHTVSEVDLTTQFLHGLDQLLDTIRVVPGDQGLPFDTVLSRVTLAEESQQQRAAEESASAFALTGDGTSGGNSTTGTRVVTDRADRSSNDNSGGDRGGRGAPHPPPSGWSRVALVNDPPNWVSDLIEAMTATWKEDLIRSVFLLVDAETILAIPLCTIPIADFWAWSHERTSRFSVRSAYKMVINIRENGANGNVGSTGAQGAPEGKAWTYISVAY
ncbi:hypothetical protein D1007_42010 [Hordeum vulgare]|nr:hypothetical protein D1007_42010 [Hordeum vulgare]